MAGRFSEKCKVIVTEDSMSASLFIEPPEDGIAYSVEELTSFVKNKGVYGGIIFSALEEMTQNNIYYKEYEIAKGTLPTEGEDGYFELFFENDEERKPTIRSDGSVDYQSMSEIQCVSAGEKLIQYHPAIPGKNGVDVRGRALRTKPTKEFPLLKGSGFSYNDDKCIYTAANDGKVEYDGKTLKITDVYEHRGDLDLVIGKIDFRGDVVVKGNVSAGTYIRATKSITIEGSVEAATLISGGDIILKKGMQGGQKARISCGGDLYANFIEFTAIEAKGKIEANIIMNCQINAGSDVTVSGKRGAIVGGNTYAIGHISTTLLGNVAGHKTVASVGIKKELLDRKKVLTTKTNSLKRSLHNIDEEIIKVSDPRLCKDTKEVIEAKLSQLKRRQAKDEKLIKHIDAELEKIEQIIEIGSRAKITVSGVVYPGSQIVVDDMSMAIESEYKASEFEKDVTEDKIVVKPCAK